MLPTCPMSQTQVEIGSWAAHLFLLLLLGALCCGSFSKVGLVGADKMILTAYLVCVEALVAEIAEAWVVAVVPNLVDDMGEVNQNILVEKGVEVLRTSEGA